MSGLAKKRKVPPLTLDLSDISNNKKQKISRKKSESVSEDKENKIIDDSFFETAIFVWIKLFDWKKFSSAITHFIGIDNLYYKLDIFFGDKSGQKEFCYFYENNDSLIGANKDSGEIEVNCQCEPLEKTPLPPEALYQLEMGMKYGEKDDDDNNNGNYADDEKDDGDDDNDNEKEDEDDNDEGVEKEKEEEEEGIGRLTAFREWYDEFKNYYGNISDFASNVRYNSDRLVEVLEDNKENNEKTCQEFSANLAKNLKSIKTTVASIDYFDLKGLDQKRKKRFSNFKTSVKKRIKSQLFDITSFVKKPSQVVDYYYILSLILRYMNLKYSVSYLNRLLNEGKTTKESYQNEILERYKSKNNFNHISYIWDKVLPKHFSAFYALILNRYDGSMNVNSEDNIDAIISFYIQEYPREKNYLLKRMVDKYYDINKCFKTCSKFIYAQIVEEDKKSSLDVEQIYSSESGDDEKLYEDITSP